MVIAGQQHPTRTVPSPGSEDAVLYLKKRAMKYLATALKVGRYARIMIAVLVFLFSLLFLARSMSVACA